MQKETAFTHSVEGILYAEHQIVVSDIVQSHTITQLDSVRQRVRLRKLPVSDITRLCPYVEVYGVGYGFELFGYRQWQ